MKKLTAVLGAAALLSSGAALALVGSHSEGWIIGPIIKGKSYSPGMPLRPETVEDGIAIDFPTTPRSHVHYVTFDPGSLEGKREIVMRYRIDAAPGTRFVPNENPDQAAKMSFFFQRRGDRWNAKGDYGFYRWYAPRHTLKEVAPGTYEMRADLHDPKWISVWGKEVGENAKLRDLALRDTERVGFVLGSDAARGHGVYATKPARITVTGFEIR